MVVYNIVGLRLIRECLRPWTSIGGGGGGGGEGDAFPHVSAWGGGGGSI